MRATEYFVIDNALRMAMAEIKRLRQKNSELEADNQWLGKKVRELSKVADSVAGKAPGGA